jgi:ADP-heptose:LPS heptosyltransferase
LGIEPDCAFVVIHPGCGGSARNWTPEHYHDLCRRLHDSGVEIVVSGSESEMELARQIKGGIGDGIHSIAGRTDLSVMAAVLRESRVFVGPSTGPMHLAAAVGTPVVALFGPVLTTGPDRWGPLGKGHCVFVPPVETCRCRINECRLGDCMAMIDPGEVAGAVTAAMAQARREFNSSSQVFEFGHN